MYRDSATSPFIIPIRPSAHRLATQEPSGLMERLFAVLDGVPRPLDLRAVAWSAPLLSAGGNCGIRGPGDLPGGSDPRTGEPNRSGAIPDRTGRSPSLPIPNGGNRRRGPRDAQAAKLPTERNRDQGLVLPHLLVRTTKELRRLHFGSPRGRWVPDHGRTENRQANQRRLFAPPALPRPQWVKP